MPYQEIYHRKLPHIQPLGGTFFVTYRLYGTLPVEVGQQLREELEAEKQRLSTEGNNPAQAIDELNRRYFGRYDHLLDQCYHGSKHLAVEPIAQLTADALHYWDTRRIDLIAYCIMTNHVHAVFTLLGTTTETGKSNSLDKLMHSLKSLPGRKANLLLERSGKFWEEESYDRLVRDNEELIRIVRYVLNNPVKAGLCQNWRDWHWSYVKPEYDMF